VAVCEYDVCVRCCMYMCVCVCILCVCVRAHEGVCMCVSTCLLLHTCCCCCCCCWMGMCVSSYVPSACMPEGMMQLVLELRILPELGEGGWGAQVKGTNENSG